MPVVPQDFSNAFAVSTIFEVEMRHGTIGLHCSVSLVRTGGEIKSGLVSITRRGRDSSA